MATFQTQPNGKTRVIIRRKGFPQISKVFDTLAEAETFAAFHEGSQYSKLSEITKAKANLSLSILELSQNYKSSPSYLQKSPNSQRRERQASAAIEKYLGQYDVNTLDNFSIQTDFIDKRALDTYRAKPISGDTLRLELAYLSSIYNYAVRRRQAVYNPVKSGSFDKPALAKREVRLSYADEEKLLSAAFDFFQHPRANPSGLFWLQFCISTGMRPGEAAKVQIDWIDFENHEVHVPSAHHKNRKPRVVLLPEFFLQPELISMLIDYSAKLNSPFLFTSISRVTKKPIPYDYHSFWGKICERAGVQGITPHGLRHEFISRLFENLGMSPPQVAALSGHTNPASLNRYTHLLTRTFRGAFEANRQRISEETDKLLDN